MTVDLTEQVALVTGANRGIGRQLASDPARAGAFVVLSARQLDMSSLAKVRRGL